MALAEHVLQVPLERRASSIIRSSIASFAIQDWLVGSYLLFLTLGALIGSGPLASPSLLRMGGLLIVYSVAMVVLRAELIHGRTVAAVLYRVAIYAPVQISYFWLRDLLSATSTRSYDSTLLDLDLRLFHFEPSQWSERFVSPVTTEWFAFFYFSYFVVLGVHVLPILFLCKRKAILAEFGLTLLTVYCVAQAMYLFVPAFGPHRAFAGLYSSELPGGFWYRAVLTAVNSGGAERDAFPSLHTAGPAAMTLFSFRHRHENPFRYTWPVTAFFTVNIILATMFLRWHYIIDVFGGLILASVTVAAVAVASPREAQRRRRAGLSDVFPAYG